MHPTILRAQKPPSKVMTERVCDERLAGIAHMEDDLTGQRTIILEFFLHLSRAERRKRLLARLDISEKHRRFSLADACERHYRNDDMRAFEEVIRAIATKHASCYVVPADNKWLTHLIVATAIVNAVAHLDPSYPEVGVAKRKEIATDQAELAPKK